MPDRKNTVGCPIVPLPAPKSVAIPMQQHIGAPAVPLVKKGDYVKKGQLIGNFENGLSCPIHASISGTVTDIEMRNSYTGYGKTAYVVIENDFSDALDESIKPFEGSPTDATPEQIIELVKNAGICGLGGASFPTYAKIQSAIGKAKEIIINCAECEPYITENHRLMLEEPSLLVNGALLLMQATGAEHMTIAIENNKMDAVKVMQAQVADLPNVDVRILKTKYPQGDERQLMYVIKGVQLPTGKLPADVGCVIFNAETGIAVYHAVYEGMPLISTVVTVDGDAVNTPQNLRIPVGTSIGDVLEACGGVKDSLCKLVTGGPMMGTAQWDLNAVVMKNTSAILALSEKPRPHKEDGCIHCGKCVGVCPMHLMPNYLAAFSKLGDKENAKEFNILSCVECGSCTYICPAEIPIVQYIRTTKGQIIADNKKEAARKAAKEANAK